MTNSRVVRSGFADGEAALGAMVGSVSADGRCGGPWTYEITTVVKHCGVVSRPRCRVLQVNPFWLRELVARRELEVLADEMRTWFAIQNEVFRLVPQRSSSARATMMPAGPRR